MRLLLKENKENIILSEGLNYHLKNKKKLEESVYRMGSESWCDLVNEVRALYTIGNMTLTENELFIIESNAGEYGEYMREDVPLDAPFLEHVGKCGDKLYGVFVLDENGKTKKVNFTENNKNLKRLMNESKGKSKPDSDENYMFIQNLKKTIKNAHEILKMPEEEIMKKLKGHKWAEDHLSTATDDVDEVNSFLMNNPTVEAFIKEVEERIEENKNSGGGLKRWFKEKWVDVSKKNKSGKHPPCGRDNADKGGYPKCRPSNKVSKKTPKVASSYSKKDKKAMTSQKRNKESKVRKSKKPNYTNYDKTKKK